MPPLLPPPRKRRSIVPSYAVRSDRDLHEVGEVSSGDGLRGIDSP